MTTEKLQINDFSLFATLVKSLSRFAEAAKFTVDSNGIAVYSKNEITRCELTSNALTSEHTVEFSLNNIQTFSKLIDTAKDVHDGDYTGLMFDVSLPNVSLHSKKFKAKLLASASSDAIGKWVSQKVTTPLKPVFEFKTTTDFIKRINSHSFITSNPETSRIYLSTDKELENNVVYATIGNRENDLNNELTLKFGLVTFGSLDGKLLIIDYKRLNAFNMIQSNETTMLLMDKNALLSTSRVQGKDNTYFNLNIYNSLLKC